MDSFEVGVVFRASTHWVTSDSLPRRWNWPRHTALPRPGDAIVIASIGVGGAPMRAEVERTEFIVTPAPSALRNLFEGTSETADIRVAVRLHLAAAVADSDAG
jgi:hypothetical protein